MAGSFAAWSSEGATLWGVANGNTASCERVPASSSVRVLLGVETVEPLPPPGRGNSGRPFEYKEILAGAILSVKR